MLCCLDLHHHWRCCDTEGFSSDSSSCRSGGDTQISSLPQNMLTLYNSNYAHFSSVWGIKQLHESYLISYWKRKIQKHFCHQRHSSALFTHHCAAHLSTKHSVHKVLRCTVFLIIWWKKIWEKVKVFNLLLLMLWLKS